ncbi:MAG: HAD-IA family hydrolase [Planctomycetia bacterium]|nr:HAD-IA family hydrolase [Planctomycetia bacterium]
MAMAAELLVSGWRSIPVLRAFRNEHERIRRNGSGGCDDPFCVQLLQTSRAIGRKVEDVESIVDRWMFQRPGKWLHLFRRRGLLTAISRFRALGGRSALVSDYPATAKLRALRAASLFDVVVACGEPDGPRRLKPHADGLLLAAQKLGIEPAACLVLGDREDADGEAARRAGMGFQNIHSWPRALRW